MRKPRKAEPTEGFRRLAVEMAEDGDSPAEVADRLGIGERSVWRWLKARREQGDQGLATRPRSGRPPKLTPRVGRQLLAWVMQSPADFGFASARWTAPRLARVLFERTGIVINRRYLVGWFARHGITPQLPEPVPRERNPQLVAQWLGERWPRIEKDVTDRDATLGFTDESGFLLMPIICRTLAPRGQTPVLEHRASHRDKVSVAAALTISPKRGRIGLHYQTYPNGYVTAELYTEFIRRNVLRSVSGPVVLVHDQGSMHKGPFVRALSADFPRLQMHYLPGYSPQFNPTEPLWKHTKVDDLGNYAPLNVAELDQTLHVCLDETAKNQTLLKSFLATTELPWDGLPRLI